MRMWHSAANTVINFVHITNFFDSYSRAVNGSLWHNYDRVLACIRLHPGSQLKKLGSGLHRPRLLVEGENAWWRCCWRVHGNLMGFEGVANSTEYSSSAATLSLVPTMTPMQPLREGTQPHLSVAAESSCCNSWSVQMTGHG